MSGPRAWMPWASLLPIPAAYLHISLTGPRSLTGHLAIVGASSAAFGGWAWLSQGGRKLITASGLYMLSSGLFIGGAAMALSLRGTNIGAELLHAAAIGHLVAVATWIVWRLVDSRLQARSSYRPVGGEPNTRALLTNGVGTSLLGLVVVLMAAVMRSTELLGPANQAAAFAGVILVATGAASFMRAGFRLSSFVVAILPIIALILYVRFFFTGFGRLVLALLALAVFTAFNMSRPAVWHKPTALVLLLPALAVSGLVGLERADASMADDATLAALVSTQAGGLESFISPLATFGELLERESDPMLMPFPRQYGRTFLTSSVVFVPRWIWQSKPIGFGALLAEELKPDVRPRGSVSGHSEAALSVGEWHANFSFFGFLLMPLILGSVLGLLDQWQRRILILHVGSGYWLQFALFLTVFSGISSYVWAGSFSFMARSGIASVVVAVVMMPLLFHRKRPRHSHVEDANSFSGPAVDHPRNPGLVPKW